MAILNSNKGWKTEKDQWDRETLHWAHEEAAILASNGDPAIPQKYADATG